MSENKSKSEEKKNVESKETRNENVEASIEVDSTVDANLNMTLFLYWVLPVLILSLVSRFGAIPPAPLPPTPPPRPISLDLGGRGDSKLAEKLHKRQQKHQRPTPSPSAAALSKMPSSYQQVVKTIKKRRPRWNPGFETTKSATSKASDAPKEESRAPASDSQTSTNVSSDPNKRRMDELIEKRRMAYKVSEYDILDVVGNNFQTCLTPNNMHALQDDPSNVMKAIHLADALRQRDLTFHDGGSGQTEALQLYQTAIDYTLEKRLKLIEAGQATDVSPIGTPVKNEFMLDYSNKSVDGLLCALYAAMGKQYFMANMFEKAVESHTRCLEIEPLYLDSVNSRGSTLIILGKYEDAAKDLQLVMEMDENRFFKDAFTGMAKVLSAKEEVGSWEPMVAIIQELIPQLEQQYSSTSNDQANQHVAESLNRLYHVLFIYHDVKTKDTEAAWKALSQGYEYKMAVLPPFQTAFEKQKLMQIKQIFNKGFWPAGVGSSTEVPIFIIGFVRSGSTLLERVLDAHPLIVGTGEDSVFNGRLDHIRNSIVEASMVGDSQVLVDTVQSLADEVVDAMRQRWKVIESNTSFEDNAHANPERFADKMLTNYFNVGFIHMLFPNALILHVAREPMDTVFSAFKHEFPPGGLDYTSEFSSLAQMYHSYRDVMEHWDKVLPGRVTHVRYEDMVHDMPRVAKAIINATGLDWDEDVLLFHKKKHAVNTLSTTQVRKGVYTHSLQAWRRYEEPLQPLVKLVGDRVRWDLTTTLPTYEPPAEKE
jgi:tetratricopeptide (TPR) repeat protein